ncbi:MAG: ABC transporter permease [Anaerolineaceae bacterium]|nr:MAG: ABC transporter permease [Anaerolineaceae bacterium]
MDAIAAGDAISDEKPVSKNTKNFTKSYTFRVILQGIITIWAATTFTFFLVRLLPGNPVSIRIDQLMQQGYTIEEARNQAATLFDFNPDEPMLQQYSTYMVNLVQGNLGTSITSAGTPVRDQILRFLPWTLISVGSALLISFSVGILLGIMIAYWRGGVLDNVITALASILSGIPDYVYAILIILIAGVQLQWFNVGEMRGGVTQGIPAGFTVEYISSVIKHALLPVITYLLATVGVWILSMKSSTISVLGEDYINVAKARGLSEGRILTAYVGRNAMLPLVTRLAISIGFVLSGSVIVERFFEYPGLGLQLARAVGARDYTTMQGIFLVITIGVIVSNILADLVMGWLDPRVSLEDN